MQRVLSGPAVAPLIDNDLDVALVDVGLKDGHLAVAHKQSVVVCGRAGNQEVVAGGCVLNSELCLKYADGVAVEADIEVQLAVIDHTVVCNDGDLRLMRGLDDGAGSVAVLRDHDERVNALRDEIFTLRILQLFVAVGRLDNQLCAKLVGFLLHILCAAFPLFFLHRCEGYANGDAVLARIGIIVRGAGIGGVLCAARKQGQDGYCDQQQCQKFRFHLHSSVFVIRMPAASAFTLAVFVEVENL